MTYTTDITEVGGFPHIGIMDENNHRWLISPDQDCPVEDEEVQALVSSTFTKKIKKDYLKYLESLKPPKEEEEKSRINSLKTKANFIILEKYPYWKQLNLMREGGSKLEEMNLFITSITDISNQAEKDGLWSNQVEWNNITTN